MELQAILTELESNSDLAKGVLENVVNIKGGREFLDNSNKAHFTENFGKEVSTIYNRIDNDIHEITGRHKDANQKTYDFVKEIITEYKGKGSNTEENNKLVKQINDLKTQLSNSDTSGLQSTIDTLKNQLNSNKDSYETKLSELQSKMRNKDINSAISVGLDTRFSKLKEQYPEAMLKALRDNVQKELSDNAKVDENGIVSFFKTDGQPYLDKQFSPANIDFILNEKLQGLDKSNQQQQQQSGGNSKNRLVTGQGDSANQIVLNPTEFSNAKEFMEQAERVLSENGITRSDKKYQSLLDESWNRYEVSKLPIN